MKHQLSTERSAAFNMVILFLQHRNVLAATTRLELAKRYSGSLFGRLWIVVYPLLFLSIYLFVYMVMGMRLPGFSRLDYVVYVFAGLVPYIAFMEALTSGCVAIKQNLHLIKNVMLPIELIPARYVFVAMTSQIVGLAMLLGLAAGNHDASLRFLALPIVLLVQAITLLGLVMVLAPLALLIPDLTYFVNLGMMFLVFVSPIGFRPEMVPENFKFVIYANPVSYMIDTFRWAIIRTHPLNVITIVGFVGFAAVMFIFGSWFLERFKDVLVDFE